MHVSNQKVYQFRSGRVSSANRRISHNDLPHDLPNVPVLSGTLLSMELAIGQPSVDLAQISQLVLSDLGATLQILRHAGRENSIDSHLQRVEDCIVELGVEGCLDVIAKCPIASGPRFNSVYFAWERARETAFIARFVAEKYDLNVAAEDAYLVGLAHEIGSLPKILEWDCMRQIGDDIDLAGLRIAEAWHLPHCISEYFLVRMAGKSKTEWTKIVDCALDLFEGRPSASLRDKSILLPFNPSERYPRAASRGPALAGS